MVISREFGRFLPMDLDIPTKPSNTRSGLCLSRSLCIAAHNFDLVSLDSVLVFEFKADIFYEKGPNFITEAIGVQMALSR